MQRFARMRTTPQAEEPTTSKRSREEDSDDEIDFQQSAKAKRCEPLRHITLDYNLATEENIMELFDSVRICGFDAPRNNKPGHWHLLAIPKVTKRLVIFIYLT